MRRKLAGLKMPRDQGKVSFVPWLHLVGAAIACRAAMPEKLRESDFPQAETVLSHRQPEWQNCF
jgi:hypothetical protein